MMNLPRTEEKAMMVPMLNGTMRSMSKNWSNKDQEIADHIFVKENATGRIALTIIKRPSPTGRRMSGRREAKERRVKIAKRASGEKEKVKEKMEKERKMEEKEKGRMVKTKARKVKILGAKEKARKIKAKERVKVKSGVHIVCRQATHGKNVGSIPIKSHGGRKQRMTATILKSHKNLGDLIPRQDQSKPPTGLCLQKDYPICARTINKENAILVLHASSRIILIGGVHADQVLQEVMEIDRISSKTTCIQWLSKRSKVNRSQINRLHHHLSPSRMNLNAWKYVSLKQLLSLEMMR